TRFSRDWSSDVCSSDLEALEADRAALAHGAGLALRGSLHEERVRLDRVARGTGLPVDVLSKCSHRYIPFEKSSLTPVDTGPYPRDHRFGNRPNVRTVPGRRPGRSHEARNHHGTSTSTRASRGRLAYPGGHATSTPAPGPPGHRVPGRRAVPVLPPRRGG